MSVQLNSGKLFLRELSPNSVLTLIHGGAGPQDPKGDAATEAAVSLKAILQSLRKEEFSYFLKLEPEQTQGRTPSHKAEKCCLLAARLLEADVRFNAGRGAALQDDGIARVSASFMESSRQKFSAVMNVTSVMHPSELAYYLQFENFSVLDNAGSLNLARTLKCGIDELVTPHRFERWLLQKKQTLFAQGKTPLGTGTIGCVSLDHEGHLAAVTSTGGVGNETVGRVGDTPTVAGNYCTARVAVSCTGYGEQILNEAFAARVAVRVEDGMSLKAALQKSLEEAHGKKSGLAAICMSIHKESGLVEWAAGTTESYFIWGVNTVEKSFTFFDAL
jgi:L-asparaginase